MASDQPPTPSRRTLLRGAALSALATVTFLATAPPQPAAAAASEHRKPRKPDSTPHRSYRAIIGLL